MFHDSGAHGSDRRDVIGDEERDEDPGRAAAGAPAKDAQRLDPKPHGRFRARGGVHRRLRNPPGSPPTLDWWFPPGAVRTTPPGELVDASLWAGLEGDPADDEVPEDLPRLGNLPPQHRPPVGQAV